jgi:hypothetical protein
MAGEFYTWRAGGSNMAPEPVPADRDRGEHEGFVEMPRTQLILPKADASCGKVFYADRRTADGHRVALEVWNRATGRTREGYRLAVYRCKRCAGFHIAMRPIDRIRERPQPPDDRDQDHGGPIEDWGDEAPTVWRAAVAEPGW